MFSIKCNSFFLFFYFQALLHLKEIITLLGAISCITKIFHIPACVAMQMLPLKTIYCYDQNTMSGCTKLCGPVSFTKGAIQPVFSQKLQSSVSENHLNLRQSFFSKMKTDL